MLRDEISLPNSLLNFYSNCDLDQGIVACLFAENKSASLFFYESFFQALATQLNFAKTNVKTALRMIGPHNAAQVEEWANFFTRYHCDELAFLVYKNTIKAIDKAAKKPFQRNINKPTKAQLQTAGRLASKCGRTQQAARYFARAGSTPEDTQDLNIAIDNDLLKLAEGKFSAAEAQLKKDITLKLQYASKKAFNIEYYVYLLISLPNAEEIYQNLRQAYEDNHRVTAKLDYYFALECVQDNAKRIALFSSILTNLNADIEDRLLAGIALCRLDASHLPTLQKFFNLYYADYKFEHHSRRDNCIILIANATLCRLTGEKKYQDKVRELLTKSNVALTITLPFSVPYYLRPAYFEVLLDERFWPKQNLTYDNTYQLAEIKRQILSLIESDSLDEETRINLAVQALCPQTAIGRIIAVPQVSKTSLTSGTKEKIVAFLSKHFTAQKAPTYYLAPATCLALSQAIALDKNFLLPIIDTNLAKQLKRAAISEPEIHVTVSDQKENSNDYPLEQYVFKNRQGEYLFAETLAHYNDKTELPHRKIKILCLAMLSSHTEASKELAALLREDKFNINSAALGDFFYRWGSYRLASQAYRLAKEPLSQQQASNAAQALLMVGESKEAEKYIANLNEPSLIQFYYQAYSTAYRSAKNAAAARALPGLHRIQHQPKMDLERAEQCSDAYQACNEIISLDAMYLNAACQAVKNPYSADTCEQWSHIITHCETLNRLQLNTARSATIEFNARLNYAYAESTVGKTENNKQALAALTQASQVPHCHAELPLLLRAKLLLSLARKEQAGFELDKLSIPAELNENNIIARLLKYTYLTQCSRKSIEPLEKLLEEIGTNSSRSALLNLAIAMAYSALGQHDEVRKLIDYSSIAPQIMFLSELPVFFHADYIAILLNQKHWPKKASIIKNDSELKALKESYVQYVKLTQNLEVGFQALCSHTALGRMFSEPRWYTDTSLTSGSNRDMLNLLEKLLTNKPHNPSHTTRAALVKQMQDDEDFLPTISRRYPNIGKVLKECHQQTKEAECNPVLFKPTFNTPNDKILNQKHYEL